MSGFMVMQLWQEVGVEVVDPDDRSNTLVLPESYVVEHDKIGSDETARFWCEYSAPGYMDRTEPVSGTTAVEAVKACFDLYGDYEDKAERAECAALLWKARKMDRQEGK